jgi:hypothetical protein
MTFLFLDLFYGISGYIIAELGKKYHILVYALIIINIMLIILIISKLYYNKNLQDLLTENNAVLTDEDIKLTKNDIVELKQDLHMIERKLAHVDKVNDGVVKESFTNFYQCPDYKLLKNLETVFNDNKIERSHSAAASDLILPCGYNNVEEELDKLANITANQKIYAIKGCDKLASKNELWGIFHKAYGFKGACEYMPRTYATNKSEEIALFKDNYKPGQLYFLKKNIQRKEGILLTRDYNQILEETLIGDYKVIQEAVDDLYLIKKRKVNLRVYLLIVCKGGIISGFLYHDGKCIYSNLDVNDGDQNTSEIKPEQHLTSLNLDVSIYKSAPESLSDLKKHLGTYKFNLLWSRIIAIFAALMKAVVSDGLVCNKKSLDEATSFQLFGADIIFTNKMKPYLLELNKGPSMKYMTENDEKMKLELTNDVMKNVGVLESKDYDGLYKKWIKIILK